ncbi:MAG: hypothetical protein ACRDZ4_11530 [Egibacteraceae bacterium]
MSFTIRPRVVARLIWTACKCGRKHFVCIRFCARRVGYVIDGDGKRYVAECARGYAKRHKVELEQLRARGGLR